MDKTLYEMIFKRKSFHIFRTAGNESISGDELDDIQNAYTAFIPLNPGIKTAMHWGEEIVFWIWGDDDSANLSGNNL